MSYNEKEIEDAYRLIHKNLHLMPEDYCCWKKKTIDGQIVTKSLSTDYRPLFSFVSNKTLRNNLAELMFCFDYHKSLFKLHEPGLTFGWQHKLVLCQIAAGIYEGILLDAFECTINKEGGITKALGQQKINSKSFGLGALIDVFSKTKKLSSEWQEYLKHVVPLRNTVHPKSLNHEDASYIKNKVIQGNIEILSQKIVAFRKFAINLYP